DHSALLAVLMANRTWFDSLTPELRQIVAEAGRKAVLTDREAYREVERRSRDIVRQAMNVHVLSKAERDELRRMAEPVYDQVRKELGPEAVDSLVRAVEEVQKGR